jgi:hypothetical protein
LKFFHFTQVQLNPPQKWTAYQRLPIIAQKLDKKCKFHNFSYQLHLFIIKIFTLIIIVSDPSLALDSEYIPNKIIFTLYHILFHHHQIPVKRKSFPSKNDMLSKLWKIPKYLDKSFHQNSTNTSKKHNDYNSWEKNIPFELQIRNKNFYKINTEKDIKNIYLRIKLWK